jgi:hypothetical protein
MSNCIQCGDYIPPNDCFCDLHEVIGCGCSIQPPNEVYLPDPDGGADLGPYCAVCADQVEDSNA